MQADNEITISTALPATDDELQARLRELRGWKRETIADIAANADAMNAGNYRKEKLNAFDGADKRLKAFGDAVGKAAMPDWAKALLVEVGAARNEVKAAITARQDKLRALKAENEPPDPTHTYALQFDVTDAGLKKILAAVAKEAGPQYRVWHVEGEKAQIAANKFFASLGWSAAK